MDGCRWSRRDGSKRASACFDPAGLCPIGAHTSNEKGPPLGTLCHLARPERFELPTARFVAEYSIQLSYGRLVFSIAGGARTYIFKMAEREGFEPSKGY